jgi:hypothetical protein
MVRHRHAPLGQWLGSPDLKRLQALFLPPPTLIDAVIFAKRKQTGSNQVSNGNPLDLVEYDLAAGAVVELGRARTSCGHGLRVFERAAGLKVR